MHCRNFKSAALAPHDFAVRNISRSSGDVIASIALGSTPHWLLAFGFALDAVARVLGTIAGERAGRLDWALWSLIGGSPAVAAITLFRQEGRMTTEPGPIAGLMSIAAMTMIGLWIIGSLLGV